MGWTRKHGKFWRKHTNQWGRSEVNYNLTYCKRTGVSKVNSWDVTWNTSRSSNRWARQRINGQQRAANKIIIREELMHDQDWQDELYEQYLDENWYDDYYNSDLW